MNGKISIADFRVWADNMCQDAHDKGLPPEDAIEVLLEKVKAIPIRDVQLKVALVYIDKAKGIIKSIIEANALKELDDTLPELLERDLK